MIYCKDRAAHFPELDPKDTVGRIVNCLVCHPVKWSHHNDAEWNQVGITLEHGYEDGTTR